MMIYTNNINCWSNKIKEMLYRFHLEEYWLSQNVCNEVGFLNKLKLLLMEASDQRWLEIVQTKEMYHIIEVLNHADIKSFILMYLTSRFIGNVYHASQWGYVVSIRIS